MNDPGMSAQIKNDRTILFLTLSLTILIAISASCGLLIKDMYRLEDQNWKIQAVAQDLVDLYIIMPVLLLSGILSYRGNGFFFFCFGGTVLFLMYTYAIYCFSVHFNALFPVYCFTFGLSVYSFIYFSQVHSYNEIKKWFDDKVPVKAVGIFFIIIAVVFYYLWLSEVLAAIFQHKTPASLIDTGLLTNPVHAIDLSLFLPGMVICAVFLLNRKPIAFLFTPVLLIFCVLMDINIAILTILMELKDISGGLTVVVMMFVLALISSILLYILFSHKARH